MACYTKAAMELAIKVQEVILRAVATKITRWQAEDYRHQRPAHATLAGALRGAGFRRLFDRQRGKASPGPRIYPSTAGRRKTLLCVKRTYFYVTTETR